MKLISHRGNINGKILYRENTTSYINEALVMGYDVEIDVWKTDDGLFLGHDSPQHMVDEEFLKYPNLLCHAKNKEAFAYMLTIKEIHCFWHEEDTYTLTSWGMPVVYPDCIPIPNSIVMDKVAGVNKCLLNYDNSQYNISVCSDYIAHYRI